MSRQLCFVDDSHWLILISITPNKSKAAVTFPMEEFGKTGHSRLPLYEIYRFKAVVQIPFTGYHMSYQVCCQMLPVTSITLVCLWHTSTLKLCFIVFL